VMTRQVNLRSNRINQNPESVRREREFASIETDFGRNRRSDCKKYLKILAVSSDHFNCKQPCHLYSQVNHKLAERIHSNKALKTKQH
jgi:hypothetical protein